MIDTSGRQGTGASKALFFFLGLLAVQLAAVSLLYNHAFTFECRAAAPAWLCGGLSGGVVRVMAAAGVLGLYLMVRPQVRAPLSQGRASLSGGWLAVQLAGFAAVLLPWTFLRDGASAPVLSAAFALWLGGLGALALGTLFSPVAPRRWREALAEAGPGLIVALGVALLAPEIAAIFQKIWRIDAVAEATFRTAEMMLGLFNDTVRVDPATKLLGIEEFAVLVGPQCSGVEGFALITSFLLLYIWLFRDQLRFPHVWLLIPLGIALSWVFNVVRIVALIEMGAHISPDLAIGGFHSHAGWLMFTILSVGLAVAAHQVSWLRKPTGAAPSPATVRSAPPPFFEDMSAAQIFPFLAFMATALLASTFSPVPELLYPLRVGVMAVVLWLFLPVLRQLEWRADPLAIGAGALIGVAWLATAEGGSDGSLAQALAALPGWLLAVWVVCRVLGTTLIVPVVEELFFRGYVMGRIDSGGTAARVLAVAVSAGLFAALHGRWIAAGLAGVVFALLVLRSKRLGDAILAHAVANGIIALWALARGDWSLI